MSWFSSYCWPCRLLIPVFSCHGSLLCPKFKEISTQSQQAGEEGYHHQTHQHFELVCDGHLPELLALAWGSQQPQGFVAPDLLSKDQDGPPSNPPKLKSSTHFPTLMRFELRVSAITQART